MKSKSNHQDFLKIIAIILMVVDHLGVYLFPEYPIMRGIGRFNMPIFCFCAGYNFHNKPKIKILLVGIILYIFTTILFQQLTVTNILISIFLGQCYLYFLANQLTNFFYKGYCHVIFLAVLSPMTFPFIDYGTISLSVMVLGYLAKNDQKNFKLATALSIILPFFQSFLTFHFTPFYSWIMVFIGILEYMMMVVRNFGEKISVNLRIISHNALYIYAIHLAIIQFIFFKLYF